MALTRRLLLCLGGWALLTTPSDANAQASGIDRDQLQALVPDEHDLQGFVRVRPQGEIPPTWLLRTSSQPTEDRVSLRRNLEYSDGSAGTLSEIQRSLYSGDGRYRILLTVKVCDSVATAQHELADVREQTATSYHQGTLTGAAALGDESWTNGTDFSRTVICREGKLIVDVYGALSSTAVRSGVRGNFPPAAVEAVARLILLRCARQSRLTGIPFRAATVIVNGKSLPGPTLVLAHGLIYVPLRKFAQAAGLQARWNPDTGHILLSGPSGKSISLAAGSATVQVNGESATSLKTPVLKESGEPVASLRDLASLVKGSVQERAPGVFHVKT